MKVRRRGEIVRLRLDAFEAQLLARLCNDLIELVRGDVTDDPVQKRLFPAGHRDDEAAESEFRSLTEHSLRTERSERAALCVAELVDEPAEIELTEQTGQRWIQVLNDLRLALGTQLHITEDEEPEPDPDDPMAQHRAIYHWLTATQDAIVRALMR